MDLSYEIHLVTYTHIGTNLFSDFLQYFTKMNTMLSLPILRSIHYEFKVVVLSRYFLNLELL